jgi:coenzyme F420-0:L-glutamate ligase/coenzyme F420-1:gamma-L-glutamate ligase
MHHKDLPLNTPAKIAPPFHQLIQERRSIRQYTDRPVERALIERLLWAATWAPSAHNRQPWRFAVLEDDDTRTRLADAMNAVLRTDLAADGLPPDQIEAHAARRRARLTRAPVLILLCITMADMHHYPDEKRHRAEWTMATQSLALAGQNLLLAAHAEGLGACWLCAPLFCPNVVRDTLGLPPDWEPQALISLGWPAEAPIKEREPLDTRVRFVT